MEEQKTYDIRLLKRIIGYLKPYKLFFTFAIILSLLATGTQLIFPYLTKIAIDRYILPSNFTGLKTIVLLYSLFLSVNTLFLFGMLYLTQLLSQFVIRDIRNHTFSHLESMRMSFFDHNPVGKLVTRVTNDAEAMNNLFTEVGITIFSDLFLLIGITIIMLKLDCELALISFLVLPPLVFLMNIFRIQVRKAYREVRKWIAQINISLNENLIGIKVVKLFNREKENCRRFSVINHNYYNATMRQIITYGIFMPLTDLFLYSGIAIIIWWGGGEVLQKTIQLGTLIAFMNYLQYFFRPIREISHKFDVIQSSVAAAERIFSLLDTKEFEPVTVKSALRPSTLQGKIEFKNVWFSYDSDNSDNNIKFVGTNSIRAKHDWILKDISFHANPGESIAIVGPTGAGKTSIIKLLLRFYEPQKGEILIDNIPIKNFDHSFLRTNLALVAQESHIFSESIKNNIRLRNAQIPDTKIKDVAHLVNAHHFIDRFPNTYEHELMERGVNLSSGERQLLTFARALAFDPKILILDEATREVDSHTEKLIQSAIAKLLESRTSIVIAHRLSTIKNVNRILVLSKGKIIEEGNHRSLLKQDGLYSTLYKLQFC